MNIGCLSMRFHHQSDFDGFYIDAGKRERKVIVNYSEAGTQREDGMMPKPRDRPKIPRHLRLPKMDEWQFYNRARLEELHAMELKIFESMVENTIQNNSLAAFLGSIKFKSNSRRSDLDYPSTPLATFTSSLKSRNDISSEDVEFILSDN